MAAAITWQVWVASMGQWRDLDTATNVILEAGLASSVATVNITPVNPPFIMQSPAVFDPEAMTLDGEPVRRSDSLPVATTTQFWDDQAWAPFDSFAQSTIHAAITAGRNKTTIYIGSVAYELSLTRPTGMQINQQTGRARPLLIQGVPPVVGDDDADEAEAEAEKEDLVDDPSMPAGYRCPITHMPMSCPVMATDGHSYEAVAIQKWLKTKTTSPMTGARLPDTTLIKNHFLAESIRNWSDAARAAGMDGQPKKKRMRTMRAVAAE